MSDEAFFLLHRDLPREGPGGDDYTREALRRLPAPPEGGCVLDLGCGPGRQSLVLAEALRRRVVAVDLHRPFLDRLDAAARGRGLAHLIETRQADMAAPPVAPGGAALIWSEGAVYLLGFGRGLRLWRPLLAAGGLLAVTECCWLTADPPGEAAAFWRDAYPGMATVAANAAAAVAAGYGVLDTFALPPAAWWDEYYDPLLERIAALRPTADGDLAAAIAATEREIELYRRCGGSYGYVFFLLRRRDDGDAAPLTRPGTPPPGS